MIKELRWRDDRGLRKGAYVYTRHHRGHRLSRVSSAGDPDVY